jgi:hypothetical protein
VTDGQAEAQDDFGAEVASKLLKDSQAASDKTGLDSAHVPARLAANEEAANLTVINS